MDSTKIIGAVQAVTKKWATQRKREERQRSATCRRREALVPSYRVTIKDAARGVMRDAYLEASANGTLPAHARQIMYRARGRIQDAAKRTLDDQYFCQTLLPDYMNEHASETADWDVVFDARGHLHEPHTKKTVPLGTIAVRQYLQEIGSHVVDDLRNALTDEDQGRFPTCGPTHRYQAILFIEKEGFLPLFEKVELAKRYDIAIMSTKGMSSTASRLLVDRLCSSHGIPLLVLHDFDKAGFSIVGTLRRDTRRYEFEHDIEVVDLGLRLGDVEKYDLPSESVAYGKSNPKRNLRENGATAAEIEFLTSGSISGWHPEFRGQRVELNAFTSGQLIEWIESKLKECGIEKLVPEGEILEQAYRRAAEARYFQDQAEEIRAQAAEYGEQVTVPTTLASQVAELLKKNPKWSWDEAVDRIGNDNDEDSTR